jgi:hypothetical protein
LALSVRVEYVPAGRYVWNPIQLSSHLLGISALEVVSGKTPEEALAAAQKRDPTVTENQIHRTRGVFAIIELNSKGLPWQVFGTPMATVQ